jgi:hypothetical protein
MYNYKVNDKMFENLNDAIEYYSEVIDYLFDDENSNFGHIVEVGENGEERIMYEIG